MDLKEKVKKLPSSPGVYLMKDSQNSIIYVGKSKNLKNRVGSYFQNLEGHSPKVANLVNNLKDFDYITTDTEFEALMLECKLIKELKPNYNKLMKSPMSYSYIVIDTNEKCPKIKVLNELPTDYKGIYFGPYTSKNTIERGIQGIKEHYRILCTTGFKKTSGCLNHSLGLCIGICMGEAERAEYRLLTNKIIDFLSGKDNSIIQEMEQRMNSYAEDFDFENAAKYRDYMGALRYIINSSKIKRFTMYNKNIILAEYLGKSIIKYYLIKGNKLLFCEKLKITSRNIQSLVLTIEGKSVEYFNTKPDVSNSISKEEIDEAQIIYNYLKSQSNISKHIIVPQKWIKSRELDKIETALYKLLKHSE